MVQNYKETVEEPLCVLLIKWPKLRILDFYCSWFIGYVAIL